MSGKNNRIIIKSEFYVRIRREKSTLDKKNQRNFLANACCFFKYTWI